MMEFDSLEGLAHHLMQETVGGLTKTKKCLESAAILLENTAKAEIGNPAMYQTEAGGFGPWPPLAESTLARKADDTPLLETGQMRDSITHEVEDWEATVGATDPKMEYHEFERATCRHGRCSELRCSCSSPRSRSSSATLPCPAWWAVTPFIQAWATTWKVMLARC